MELRKVTSDEEEEKIAREVGKMENEKSQPISQKRTLEEALKRQSMKKTKDTLYYTDKPEKLLGMINMFFEKQGLNRPIPELNSPPDTRKCIPWKQKIP